MSTKKTNSRILSMTGYGHAEYKTASLLFTAQARSVNHRFLDVKVKLPRSEWMQLDYRIRKLIADKCSRGSIEILISVEPIASKSSSGQTLQPTVLNHLLGEIEGWKKKQKKRTWFEDTVSLDTLLRLPGAFGNAVSSALESFDENDLLETLVTPALENLCKSRALEGTALNSHITDILTKMDRHLHEITGLEKQERLKVRDVMRERIESTLELIGKAASSDEFSKRLSDEAAFWIDRRSFEEERIRLKAHFETFRSILEAATAPKGRKLEFLQQEMHREVNTLGNKAQSSAIADQTLAMKSLLEALKEQLANVE